MKNLINRIRKFNFVVFTFFILSVSSSNAQIYNEIKVSGNERLSVETIIMFSGLKIGKDIKSKLGVDYRVLYRPINN